MATPSPPTTEKPLQQTPEVTPEAQAVVAWMEKFDVTIQKNRQPSPEQGESEKHAAKVLEREQKEAWEALAGAVKATETQIADLKKWGVGAAAGHQSTLDGIKAKGSEVQKKYKEAADEFGTFKTVVSDLHTAEK